MTSPQKSYLESTTERNRNAPMVRERGQLKYTNGSKRGPVRNQTPHPSYQIPLVFFFAVCFLVSVSFLISRRSLLEIVLESILRGLDLGGGQTPQRAELPAEEPLVPLREGDGPIALGVLSVHTVRERLHHEG